MVQNRRPRIEVRFVDDCRVVEESSGLRSALSYTSDSVVVMMVIVLVMFIAGRDRICFARQRRLFQICGDGDDAAHSRADSGDGHRVVKSGLQIKMRGINADGGESGHHSIGGAGDARGEHAFQPQFPAIHVGLVN